MPSDAHRAAEPGPSDQRVRSPAAAARRQTWSRPLPASLLGIGNQAYSRCGCLGRMTLAEHAQIRFSSTVNAWKISRPAAHRRCRIADLERPQQLALRKRMVPARIGMWPMIALSRVDLPMPFRPIGRRSRPPLCPARARAGPRCWPGSRRPGRGSSTRRPDRDRPRAPGSRWIS